MEEFSESSLNTLSIAERTNLYILFSFRSENKANNPKEIQVSNGEFYAVTYYVLTCFYEFVVWFGKLLRKHSIDGTVLISSWAEEFRARKKQEPGHRCLCISFYCKISLDLCNLNNCCTNRVIIISSKFSLSKITISSVRQSDSEIL